MLRAPPSQLYGLVDMGSNGIRFSITDLSPDTARSLPTVYQDREGISLFDAQYLQGEKGPIPQDVINDVLAALLRFKTACADFGVAETNIRILATEATRTAVNSDDYRSQIKQATGWEVDMLPKEAEGRIGAMGVASSFATVEGLVMDLGGGSTQITWMIAEGGKVETSPKGSISFPYGAAAMTQRLASIDAQSKAESARESLANEIKQQFQQAYQDLNLPSRLQHKAQHGGIALYLSGGGFRGWGYLLMSQHKIHPYPIPIINGFHVSKRDFQQTADLSAVAADTEKNVFRISKRRAAQVPAVAFLVNALVSAIPMIKEIRFCQGGVREGFLYDTLDTSTRALDPLTAATKKYGTDSASQIADLLWSSLPPPNNELDRSIPEAIGPDITRALADTMYVHGSQPKETRSLSGLHAPITGILASAHGVSHTDRAILALALCQRWQGELAAPHESLQARLSAILTPQEAWWAGYLGAVAFLIGQVYPAGIIQGSKGSGEKSPRLAIEARWSDGLGKKGLEHGVRLKLKCSKAGERMTCPSALNPSVEVVESVGKKKNRVGGRDSGFGVRVVVGIERGGA